jgi:chromosome segregation ATPase
VDFLNEQLALREAQLVDQSAKVERAEDLERQIATARDRVDVLQTENASLGATVRVLESKIEEITASVDPEGDVTLEELFDATSAHSAKAVQDMLNGSATSGSYAEFKAEQQASMSLNRSSASAASSKVSRTSHSKAKTGKKSAASAAVSPPEVARMSGGRRPPSIPATGDPIGEQMQALGARSKQLEKDARRLVGGGRRGGVDHSSDMSLFTKDEHESAIAELKAELVAVEEDNATLREIVEESQGGEAVVRERIRRGEERISELREELAASQQQADVLAVELARKEDYISAREVEYSDLQRRLEEAAARVGNHSSSSAELSQRVSHLEYQLADVRREKDKALAMCDAYQTDLSVVRAERLDAMSAKEELEAKDRVVSRELAKVRELGSKSSIELNECRTELVKAHIAINNATMDAESSERRAASASDAAEAMASDLNKVKGQLSEAVSDLARRQMSEAPGSVAETLRNDMLVLRQKCDMLEEAQLAWKRERSTMSDTITDLQRRQALNDEMRMQGERDHEQLVEEVVSKNDTILELQREKQRLEMACDKMSLQLRSQEASIGSLNAAARERDEDVSVSLNASQMLNADITMLSRRCADAEEAYNLARQQTEKENKMLVAATRRANEAETQVDSLTTLVAANQEEISALQSKLSMARDAADNASRRAESEKSSFGEAIEKEMELQRTIAALRVAVASAEKESRAQALKNTRLLATLNEGEDSAGQLSEEISALKSQLADKDARVSEVLSSLASLDQARDAMQNELDTYQENDLTLRKELAGASQREGQQQRLIEQTERRLREVSDDLASTRRACKELDARMAAMREENSELKRRYGMRNADMAGAAEDLMLMTKENQALTNELAECATDRDRMRSKVQELMARLHTTDQGKRALEIEREDLINTYRVVLGDKRKVENELNALGQTKQRAGVNMQQLQEQVGDLTGVVNAHATMEKRWAAERGTMVKQLEGANDELVRGRNRIDAVEADNRRLMQDTHALRQTNVMLKERVEMVIRRATSAADANKILSSRLSSVERERDAVRALVTAERQKSEEYGTLIESARAQVAQKDLQMARMGGGSGVADSSATFDTAPSVAGESSASSAAAAAHFNSSLGLSEEDSR